MKIAANGKVKGVYLGLDTSDLTSTPQSVVQVTFEGFSGDRHSGITRPSDGHISYYPRGTLIRNFRQVSIVSVEELAEIAAKVGIEEIRAEWLGANLCLGGIPHLTALPPATRLFFPSGAVITIEGENLPCTSMAQSIQRHTPGWKGEPDTIVRAALRRRGLVGWVERPGAIRRGDEVQVGFVSEDLYELWRRFVTG
jgi:hypothetical protein